MTEEEKHEGLSILNSFMIHATSDEQYRGYDNQKERLLKVIPDGVKGTQKDY